MGVKLVGMFGNFRPTKVSDQIEMLTCATTRQYLFEFNIEGRVSSDFIVVQFSSLYTNLKGERYFIIESHSVRVSDSQRQVLESIDYINVNISYVRGVVHNVTHFISSLTTQGISEACSWPCKKGAGSTCSP